jgi:hypothetical protein
LIGFWFGVVAATAAMVWLTVLWWRGERPDKEPLE